MVAAKAACIRSKQWTAAAFKAATKGRTNPVRCVYGFTLCVRIYKRGAGGGATYVGGESEMAEASSVLTTSPRSPRAGPRARV